MRAASVGVRDQLAQPLMRRAAMQALVPQHRHRESFHGATTDGRRAVSDPARLLFYPGFEVVPPFVIHRTGKTDAARYASMEDALGERLDALFETQPIPYRRQNAGDYEIPQLTLRADLVPEREGFAAHVA
jgi:hypothetical protein